MRGIAFAAIAIGALTSAPASAVDVVSTGQSSATPAALWKAVGDWCGIADWHPAVAKCAQAEAGGVKTRVLSLKGGGEIKEKLVNRDDGTMQYTYQILESPLPVSGYESTIAVKPASGGSQIVWTGHFNAKGASDAEAKKVVQGIYDAGVASLVKSAK